MSQETIDITPTWRAILPVLVESRVNIERKRAADECDGFSEGWCSIHDAEVVEAYGSPICAVKRDRAKLAEWQKSLWEARDASDASFGKMAAAADRYNLISKAYREHLGPNADPHDDTAFHEALYAILTGKEG